MAPDEGLALVTELAKARRCFVLETELHLIYLVTPYNACHSWGNIDWMFYLDLWEKLPTTMKRVAELVGVKESFIVRATRGKIQTNTHKSYQELLIHKRFFIALALQDLVNEKPLGWVCSKFNCNRGMLQSLQQSASSFAGMVTSFSRQLGWVSVELLISQFQDRLQFGISRDLLDLMRLPLLSGKLARTLFNAGIETLAQLANCAISKIENILHRETPFQSEKQLEGQSGFDNKQRNKFRNVWISGKEGLTERQAAEMLVTEAREYLKLEMGLTDAKWQNNLVSQDLCYNKLEQSDKLLQLNANKKDENISQNPDISTRSISNISADSTKIEDSDFENTEQQTCDISCNTFQELSHTPIKDTETIDPSQSIHNSLFNKFNSDESLLEETFRLTLSDGDNNSFVHSEKKIYQQTRDSTGSFPSNSFLENAFSDTFNDLKNMSSSSRSSVGTYSNDSMKKRKSSLENCQETPSKKQKYKEIDKKEHMPVVTKKLQYDDQVDCNGLQIVDVCVDQSVFDLFIKQTAEQNTISLSLGCISYKENVPTIGFKQDGVLSTSENKQFCHNNKELIGISLCWGSNVAYYMVLNNENYRKKILNVLKTILINKALKIKMFGAKEQIKILENCGIKFRAEIDDAKVADWILDPEGKEKNLQAMVSDNHLFFINHQITN